MRRTAPGRRMAGAALVASLAIAAGLAWPTTAVPAARRPSVVVVLTDDQRWDTIAQMPWLAGELARSDSSWTELPVAVANTPLCCPARASLLTGRYARHTRVLRNEDGWRLDESSTLATWLQAAGYRTGLFGKYLNRFPFGRDAYVPAGWDRFLAKRNQSGSTVYRGFEVVDQGSARLIRGGYATDWLAERALAFVRSTPSDVPLFLLFAPSAPHAPWLPASRHDGRYADLSVSEPINVVGALRGAPAWIRSLPPPSAAQRASWLEGQRRAAETLLAVDDAIRRIVGALGDRRDETLVVVLSDNGYSFGEHRWEGKRCPYDSCVRIPMAVRSPWGTAGTPPLVSIVDVAPTILGLAGLPIPWAVDGRDVSSWLDPRSEVARPSPEDALFLEWAGDRQIPAWTAVRTRDLKLIRYEDGFEELYDVGGLLRPADPWETVNLIDDPRYGLVRADLRALLGRLGAGR